MVMSFDIDTTYLIYGFAALSTVLFVEAIYILCFSTASYRKRINRRLRLIENEPDRQNILVQLRRERGLTAEGLYGMPVLWLNKLVLQSGLTMGIGRFAMLVFAGALTVFMADMLLRDSLLEAIGILFGASILLPFVVLRFMRSRRHAKFGEQFPEAIDMIVRSLRAGHPVPIALALVARELPDPVGTEFGIVADEITYGSDLESAMRNLFFRVGQSDLPLFVTAVAIQTSTGGNLTGILANLSSVIRLRFKMRRKVSALASEGKFSAFFLSGLPIALFVILNVTSPGFYGSVWDYDVTKIGLACAAAWMIAGNIVMYRMVNFRI
ncbi:MAG TPA: type II secretion system F family protein [Xanthobacteraceae bacterium]|jgi:tight adherence protein B|nr:type II secretion system F family protein [Xanthobacteraceae bacterium]